MNVRLLVIVFIGMVAALCLGEKIGRDQARQAIQRQILEDQQPPADQLVALSWEAVSSPAANSVFVGDSLTAFGPWAELFPGRVVNRGIAADTTQRTLNRLTDIERLPAKQAIVMLGINDILLGEDLTQSASRYEQIISRLRSSGKRVIVESTLPVASWQRDSVRINQEVEKLNELLRAYCQNNDVTYVPISIPDEKIYYIHDGVHFSGAAYLIWAQQLKPYLS